MHYYKFKSRTLARKCIFQGLYCNHLNKKGLNRIKTYLIRKNKTKLDKTYFKHIFQNIIQKRQEINSCICEYLNCNIEKINYTELIIFQLFIFELFYQTKTPINVIKKEALLLVKEFTTNENYVCINAKLNQILKIYTKNLKTNNIIF